VPYLWIEEKMEGVPALRDDGICDISLELKWRFYEKEKFSLALKPGITFPTGDDEKGMGAGKLTGSLFLIATSEVAPCTFHLNLGYAGNENTLGEREDMWHLSLAGEMGIMEKVKIVANIGAERNPDRESDTHPAFILGGIVCSVSENLDVDFGAKAGLNKPETDWTILAGMAVRF